MLSDDVTTTSTPDDLPRPPAGRRSSRRPSGPPAAKTVAAKPDSQPTVVSAESAPAESASPAEPARRTRTRRPRKPVEAVRETPVEAVIEQPTLPTEPVTGTDEVAKEAKPARKRAPRKQTSTETGPRRRTRTTARKPVVEEGAELSVADAIAERAPLIADPAATIPVLSPAETEQALAELAAAIANASAEAEVTVEEGEEGIAEASEADRDAAEDGDADDDRNDGAPRRRRRRRGGRRRRRSTDPNENDEADESDEDEDAAADTTEAAESEAEGETDGETESVETDEQGDGTHRRRRRRRRRGEDTTGDDDPDTEVVVRVREPRGNRAKASDQVTGIDGSTRVEAKRQRRREGRAAGRRRAPILSESEFLSRREAVNRVMAVRQREDYTQIAVLEDGILVEHYVDRATSRSLIGNIYVGRVQNVLPGMEAAFIDIGRGRNAVLYAGEVEWDSFGDAGSSKKMEDVFKSGQQVVVQVTKDPVGAKGARLTGHISLPGRYIVYAPGGDLSGISRKLPDTERARLKAILDDLTDGNESFIVRTAAEGVDQEELQRDVTRLKAQWEAIQKKVKQGSAPQLLYAEPDPTVRIVRDLFTEDFAKLVIAGNGTAEDAWESIHAYVEHVAPHLVDRIERWDADKGDLFADFRVDEQIQKALERKVFLPSGGSLVIDRTEAMTVVDVNTGKFTGSGGNLEETVTRNNLEAAEEIVRQLRLRDVGGIIVIDFIDMVLPSNRELLLRRLVECLSRDRTRHQVAEVTSLGLVQMTRKKIGTGLAEAFTQECETCKGRGYHRHEEPVETQAAADGGDRSERKQSHSKGRKRSTKSPKSAE
ncbi:MAG: Rne/Rng family ribonuclease [Propionibacteriaceae bacterium]